MSQRGASGLGLGHLGKEIPVDPKACVDCGGTGWAPAPAGTCLTCDGTGKRPKNPEKSVAARRSNRKGKDAEREVVKLWREYYPHAARSPHSGGWRPSGGSVSPMPGDLIGIRNWICEVKFNELMCHETRGGWDGQVFIRATLRKLEQETRLAGSRYEPVLFARGSRMNWQVWVASSWFNAQTGRRTPRVPGEWICLTVDEFFDLDQGRWVGRDAKKPRS